MLKVHCDICEVELVNGSHRPKIFKYGNYYPDLCETCALKLDNMWLQVQLDIHEIARKCEGEKQ